MGYDMYSRDGGGDEGYFRLNIWGMGWMRGIMAEADPLLAEDEVMKKFCSNDGWLIDKNLGRHIASALRKYVKAHPVGSKYKDTGMCFDKKELPPGAEIIAEIGSILPAKKGEKVPCLIQFVVDKALTEEDIDIIKRFADYNETQAPYEVC